MFGQLKNVRTPKRGTDQHKLVEMNLYFYIVFQHLLVRLPWLAKKENYFRDRN